MNSVGKKNCNNRGGYQGYNNECKYPFSKTFVFLHSFRKETRGLTHKKEKVALQATFFKLSLTF
jgi:hypothetical protein